MASISYTTAIALSTDGTTMSFEVASFTTVPQSQSAIQAQIENTLNLDAYDFSATDFPDLTQLNSPPYTESFTSTTAGMGAIFPDGVYEFSGDFDDVTAGNTYQSSKFFLNTFAIDAGIAAMPTTTPAEIARKAYLVGLGQAIQAAPLTTNLERAAVNALIGVVESYLYHLTNAAAAVTSSLSAPTDIDVNISPLAFTYTTWGGWYNALTNTLTNVVYPYTFNFDPNNGGSYTAVNPTDYPDGVYENYMSVLGSINATDANLFYGTSYLLVTTTMDAQITLFEDNYDPNNTAEAIALSELQSLQTEIAAAFTDEDYTLTNSLIAEAQAILANGLSREVSAVLTSDADMSVFFTVPPAMPTGTYTEGSIEITNTLTGVAFTFDGFPTNSTDLTQLLNSETLGFGADFPDGVYQIVVTFYVDGLLFTAQCLLPVTTDWQCCIDKSLGKKCGKINTVEQQGLLDEAVEAVSIYSDYDTANALIVDGNRKCSGCGCGCS